MKGRVVVVGAGIAGLCVALALARRGVAVEVFEQGPVPNPLASSVDEHRVIRHAYGLHRGYGRMMPSAFAAWDRLFTALGQRFLVPTGLVFALRGDDTWARETEATLVETGVPVQTLSPAALAHRLPMLDVRGVTTAFSTEGDGLLLPARILPALVLHLAGLGVVFRPGTAVTDVDPVAGAVTAGGARITADHVVVAAGPWLPRLLPELAGDVVPSRQAVAYLAPPSDLAAAWAAAPVVVDFRGDSGTYTVPPRVGTRLKIGDHVFTRAGDPDDGRAATRADLDALLAAAAATWQGFDRYTVLEARACFYAVRSGERFLVRRLGSCASVVSACSGHGFKFGPLVGEALAAAIDGERSPDAVERWAAGEG
jgi:glycine/D-amino acid oxidase-like deaminating enzyme